jgi:hypothetical protein
MPSGGGPKRPMLLKGARLVHSYPCPRGPIFIMLGCLLALCSVRLHARSHARGLKLPGMVLERPMHCHWRLPMHDPCSPQVSLGLQRLNVVP